MLIKQISVFVENQRGRLSEIMGVLSKNHVDLRAVSLADTSDFGILRMIVPNPDQTVEMLQVNGVTASTTEVIAAELEDHPGALHMVLEVLSKTDISVEYIYAFITRKDKNAYVILRVEDNQRASEALISAGINLLSPDEVYGL